MNTKEHLDRTKFFRSIQVYPTTEILNIEGWLNNFTVEERDYAATVLGSLLYFDKRLTKRLLQEGIARALSHICSVHNNLGVEEVFRDCIFSTIPGERSNPTDSGNYILRLARDSFGIAQSQIIPFAEISIALKQQHPIAVILLDDFVGTGEQMQRAWHIHHLKDEEASLSELAESSATQIVYVPLIANYIGVEKIRTECNNLLLLPTHTLGHEYNIFHPDAACWQNDHKLYQLGTSLLIEKSKKIGIKETNGTKTHDLRGYGQQGLVIAFEHHVPDAVPPIFYWKHGWTPLVVKS